MNTEAVEDSEVAADLFEGKSRAEIQATVDAAHLMLLLAAAAENGLVTRGKPDEQKCRQVIDAGAVHCVTPRHDLLEPAKLLTSMQDLRAPRKMDLNVKTGFAVNVRLRQVERTELQDFTGLWAMTDQSRRQNVPDVAICNRGLVVRLEGHYYLLPPEELYAAVADAFGMALVREAPVKRSPTDQWRMRFEGDGEG
jgi:hypothetical protein